MFAGSPTKVNMKYCLLLCGMLMCFSGFSQGISDEQGSHEEVAKSNIISDKPEAVLAGTASKAISKTGYASYYAKKFEGRKTTSGVRYCGKKMTAAHLSLPFGTIVRVTNLSNGRSVDVEINDRGPHSKKFMIDLSEGAAKELGFFRHGVAKVEISYLPEAD